MTAERLRELADALEAHERSTQGDGQAVFLDDMTEEQYEAYVHEQEQGWSGFMNRVRRITSGTEEE